MEDKQVEGQFSFADCFVEYEEREDEDGNSYTVVIPMKRMETVYRNLESWM